MRVPAISRISIGELSMRSHKRMEIMDGSGHKSISASGRKVEEAASQERSLPSQKGQSDELSKFVRDQNVAHFKKCLKEATDEKQQQVLLQLLADELARK